MRPRVEWRAGQLRHRIILPWMMFASKAKWAAVGPPSFLLRLISFRRPANLRPMKTKCTITVCIITC